MREKLMSARRNKLMRGEEEAKPDRASPCCAWDMMKRRGKDGERFLMCPQCGKHYSLCCGAEIHDEVVYRKAPDGEIETFLNMDVCSKCHKPCDSISHKPVKGEEGR